MIKLSVCIIHSYKPRTPQSISTIFILTSNNKNSLKDWGGGGGATQ